jgi:tripartite-type tricarboxylate transporter receptor subunit TctC
LPEIKTRMTELGMEPLTGTPAQLGQRMDFEIKRWAIVIDKAGIPRK